MRKLLLLGFLFAIVGFAQSPPPPCGQYAHPILFAGNWYCIPTAQTTTGTVTSVTIAGTANQITATGTCTITSTGTCTLSLPSAVTLSAPGTASSITFGNATSGALTLQPVTGALGTVTASLPANTGTIAELNLAQTWTAQQIINATAAGGGALALLVAPAATANYGTLSIGSGAFDGSTTGHFAGSSSGTQIAVNATSGFGGNLIDLQVAGTSYFSVSSSTATLTGGNHFLICVSGTGCEFDSTTSTHNIFNGGQVGLANNSYLSISNTSNAGTKSAVLSFAAAGVWSVDTSTVGNGLGNFRLTPSATVTGDVSVCWQSGNALTQGSVCGTSLAAYKTAIQPLEHGLDYLMRMNPVTFAWKSDGRPDLGMIADEVAAIDPLLGAYRADGSLYNFRDRPVLAILVKAVQEMEAQIKTLEAK